MTIENVDVVGLIVSWSAFILFAIKLGIEITMTYAHKKDKIQGRRVAKSKQLLSTAVMGSFVLGLQYTSLMLKQGFYLREAGIMIWWPRFISYALCFATVAYSLSSFLWLYIKDKIVTVLSAFAFWVIAGIMGSFTAYDEFHWVYFGVSFAPLLGMTFIWCWRKQRTDDSIANMFIVAVLLLTGGLGTVWGLSPAGGNIIDLETSFWIYLALEFFLFIIVPCSLVFWYIPKKYAIRSESKHYRY